MFTWCVGCLAVALLAGCWGEDRGGGASRPAPEVAALTIVPREVVYTTELPGRTSPFQVAEVRPQVNGIIQKRLFREGADVASGATLYQIDPAIYKAALDSARAALARAEANVEPARLRMQRFRNLVRTNAVSRQDFEDAEAAYKQAAADVGVCRAAVEDARIRLDYTRVTSPISGRIGTSRVTPGALVTANQATALTTVQQLDPIYVDVTQPSVEMLRLKRRFESGQLRAADNAAASVRLVLEDGSVYSEAGALQFTDVTVEESTGAVTVRAIFPNPRQELLPGMYVRAVLQEGLDERAILLPQRALQRDARGNASAMVLTADNRVEVRPLQVGRAQGTDWVVLEGLSAGDRVVVEGLQKIRPGMIVRVAEKGDAAPASDGKN